MFLYQIHVYRTNRFHWIQCESLEMLVRICSERHFHHYYHVGPNDEGWEAGYSVNRIIQCSQQKSMSQAAGSQG